MLIQGTCNTNKTDILAENYVNLEASGIKSNQILTIVLNPYKKSEFLEKIYKLNPALKNEKHNVFTFWGLCYNSFINNWKYISTLINSDNDGDQPNLCGLEVSQYIFKQSIKEADFSDYISKINLLHQLFRRYSLIVQNCLTNEEIKQRSTLLKESFLVDAQKAIDDYKLKTIQYKSFDYLRQMAILPVIYNKTDYFNNINYLFADDTDEFSYAFWNFVEAIMPNLKDYFITYDEKGSSRCGYLCAYKSGVKNFIKKYSPQIIYLEDKSEFKNNSDLFFNNIKNGKKFQIQDISFFNFSKRMDMFENVLNNLNNLLRQGIKPNEISIISPLTDSILTEYFISKNTSVNFQVLSGNEKLIQNSTIKHIIAILKLINNFPVSDFELKSLFINLLKMPCRKCLDIIINYHKNKTLNDTDLFDERYEYSYKKLISLIKSTAKSKNKISDSIKIIYENLIKEFAYDIDKEKYEFLIKEAKSFETAFIENSSIEITSSFIVQIENSVISENPADSFSINPNSVIISSPQKIIDYSIKTKYQFWLDISNNEWLKQDSGTLYNAWVFNRDWDKDQYTVEDEISLTREKTARVVRKLMLCASEKIYFYSSIYDNQGNENFGGLNDFFDIKQEKKSVLKITPRKDQESVLEYTFGKMGIMAVPGAGKTTILLALIIKLINKGIKPENIFVLTYMESAAKNFKERILAMSEDSAELPNISTIHGLALRIIKENGNFSKAGLDDNFEVCDDSLKEKFAKEIFYKLKIDEENYDNYLKCISIVKLSGYSDVLYSKFKEIQTFYNFYTEYNTVLKQNNYIDYDDMLFYAVKILENNPEILNYYQNICKYVIEDEAQDSTDIQQKLVSLLTGKSHNFVRCGDINQAITSTFTNSNPQEFRKFINNNHKTEMSSSQRCAKPIFELANNLIKKSFTIEDTKNSFYKIEMQGTDKNPQTNERPKYLEFDNEKEERNYIIEKIKQIKKIDPTSSIAVLLRLNSQVNEYNEIFIQQNIKTAIRTDSLSQKHIYKIVIAILKVIQNPLNNENIIVTAQEYDYYGRNKFHSETYEFLKTLKEPFINSDIDNLEDENLMQLYWDINYWLNESVIPIYTLVQKIGLYYSKNNADKSNSYILSAIVKRICTEHTSTDEIIKELEYIAYKPLSAFKFFEDENNTIIENPINIMTMHKSKGDEFDYIFIPEFNEENYPVLIKNVKLKSGSHFIQTIKNSVENSGIKSPEQLKEEQVNETLRLIYVGITRAKKELCFSTAKSYRKRKNVKSIELFESLIQ